MTLIGFHFGTAMKWSTRNERQSVWLGMEMIKFISEFISREREDSTHSEELCSRFSISIPASEICVRHVIVRIVSGERDQIRTIGVWSLCDSAHR
jgi:hypothetical protein